MLAWDQHRKQKSIELGTEPPIAMGDTDPSRYTRRGVSVRWLFGVAVTAVTSVALMGGALFAALDGRYVVKAEAATFDNIVPQRAQKAQKGDRVLPAFSPVASSRIIEVSTVVRQGDKNLIAKRPYQLVSASLVLDSGKLGDIPAFNPRELERPAEAAAESVTDAIYDRAVDGEITVSVSALPLDGNVPIDRSLDLEEDEVERQLREEQYGEPSVASRVDVDAFVETSLTPPNVIVVPENVSELMKTSEAEEDVEEASSDLVEVVQPGDTLSKILHGSGIGSDDTAAIDAVLSRIGVETLRPGQILRMAFELDETDEEAQRRPIRFSIYTKESHVATVALTDDGKFVLGEAPPGAPPVVDEVQPASSDDRLPTVYKSLYQTATDNGLPDRVRDVLLATFGNDVDYNSRVRAGDQLTALYSAKNEAGTPAEILYAALTASGVERRFYRFKSPDGTVDYYDEDGRTGDKFLLRKPMERGVYRSGFGMRRHPILHRQRLHKGVDYAAPRGTRIYAAGDGVVTQAGWKAGYGRWVAIRHKNGYETGYAHQSRIEKGIKPGMRVKQGQIIGYVGSTGFSTGPHLHFEVHVNGRPVNPLKIRLRRGRELTGEQLVAFRSERDRIDALIGAQRMEMARR
ncbi:M23 family metallopeptidase [Acuticoccus kandeliae]|uniref:M23 family metallopeptidase n=1 Tax=Acuticoccus kandeliae TaxID=2073160 RepID=UPI001300AD79|nr:M23 family metallopeptidase [Acuticoccus kandeliae]